MIDTGDAAVAAMVDNSVNFNYADVDCGCTWDVMAKIADNGAELISHMQNMKQWRQLITLNLDSVQTVGQANAATSR